VTTVRDVLLISRAIDVITHHIIVTFELPEPSKWQVVKSESHLTNLPWRNCQMTCDEHARFCAGAEAVIASRRFAKTFTSATRTASRSTTASGVPVRRC
jgi:hypothetical protein